MSTNFAWEFVTPHRIVMLHTEQHPTDAQWDAYLEKLAPLDPSTLSLLVLTLGGSPSAAQRKKLNDWIDNRTFRRAVVTKDMIARKIITALSWFDGGIKGFSPEQLADAFGYLGLDEIERARYRAVIERLKKEMDAEWWLAV